MRYLIGLLLLTGVFMTGYAVGELYGNARTINQRTATEYLQGHNQGCDDIVMSPYNGAVCEVYIKDTANLNKLDLYIIGKDAA